MLKEAFECLDAERCDVYLKKLGLKRPGSCDREFLDRLIARHLEIIPFENLDVVQSHKTVSTELGAVYKKVVENGRGGYCFELNALFLGLLRGLGYDGFPVACRVMAACKDGLRMPTHRASAVRLDGRKYFCDVGFGGIACTRAALMEPGEITETKFGSFILEREYEGWLMLRYLPARSARVDEAARGQREPADILMISENACAPVDFEYANRAMCREGSRFYDRLVVQRITEYGPCSIEDHHVILRDENGKKEFEAASDEELCALLREKFFYRGG